MNKGISVILCCYNSVSRLKPTLIHLAKQNVPKHIPWEIIIIDNNSNDGTGEIAKEIWNSFNVSYSLKVKKELRAGLSHARKKGIKTAQYKYIVFCDDDNWLNDDYLLIAFEVMESNPKIGILGGQGEATFEVKPPKWFREVEKKYAIGQQGDDGKQSFVQTVYGAGMIVKSELYSKLENLNHKPILTGRKGEQLSSGEDDELCLAAQLLGYEIHCNNELRFKHFIPKERLTKAYFSKLSKGMIHGGFVLYAYILVLKKVKCSYFNYALATIYLLTKNTFVFIYRNLSIQSKQKRISNLHIYTLYIYFLLYPKTLLKHWRELEKSKLNG